MEEYKLLQIAAEEYDEHLSKKPPSSLGMVKNLIRSACLTETNEADCKKRIEASLTNVYKTKKESIGGCKSKDVQDVVRLCFGIQERNLRITKSKIDKLSSKELYCYFCYMERMAKSPFNIKKLMIEDAKRIKEIQKKEDIEKKEREEREKQDKLDEMSWEEKVKYEISIGKDIEYYQKLKDYGDNKKLVAELIKNYWVSHGKWEGNKVSQKQSKKIQEIKLILEEGAI